MSRFIRSLSALSVIAASLTVPAIAQNVPNPGKVQSGNYVVEPAHTQVGFSVLHFGFTNYSGLFSDVSGALKLNAKNPSASSLNVTIPVDSVQTTSPKLTEELKGSNWFDAAKYPTAKFVSTKVTPKGSQDALVTGNLTIHGVTKPETLTVHFIGAGVNALDKKYTTGFQATTTIKRSDFGVKMFVPYVSDEVRLTIAGAFERQD
ncbi:YceI family protein [Swingsia samuiensis]|uniref:Polyisoprenoid-binding protein n=1 Tax=Swingsia samuiensis TaxID=1293412 RepID=A0A4Y6UIV2_9PROT|nr:YceI family protein [Swingsia samuiensis]QDH16994.1 polyisoprenoid-binding protein [Swingsia samuiensis]